MANKISRKRLFIKIFIGLLLVLLIGAIYLANSFSSSAQKWFDGFYACQPNEVSDEIVVLEIDDASLQNIGLWPWPRTIIADLLNRIEKFTPAKVGIDINFVEASSAEDDLALQSVLNEYENIYLPIEAENLFLSENDQWMTNSFLRSYYFLQSKRLGHINFINSQDNIVRQIPGTVIDQRNSQTFSSFSSLLANLPWAGEKNQIYFCPAEYFNSISAQELFGGSNEDYLQNLLQNKIVLIGLSSPDLHDYVYTPISQGKYMFGVYLHANALNTLLMGKEFHSLNSFLELGILLIFLLFYLFYLLFTENYTVSNLIVAFALAGVILFVNMLFFDMGILFNGWYFLLGIIILYLYVLMVHYVFLYLSKQDLRKMFGFYLSEAVLNDLINNPDLVKLGGVRRHMTVLFSDLRGFTSLSEKLSPEQLVKILNIYLTEMSDVVLKENGVIDKYMGDAIMAFWGAPLDDKRHAFNACLAAWKMKNLLVEMNNDNAWQEDVILKLGIGVNSGEMIVGNMGGAKRFDYTVMGDSVNLGSRLEGLNKIYGSEIIISESVHAQVKDEFVCRILDKVAVKGKSEPVTIYELLGPVAEATDKAKAFATNFAVMFDKYLAKDFFGALELLEKMPAEDLSVQVYLDRCREYLKNPPAENWDGVYVLKTK